MLRPDYTEYRCCTLSMGVYAEYKKCIRLYTVYKLTMSYDTESPQPDDDLYDTESTQPLCICNPIIIYLVLVALNYSGKGWKTFTSQHAASGFDLHLKYT